MVPVCDKRYHIYNRFRQFGAEIKKLWNYPMPMFKLCKKYSMYNLSRTRYSDCMCFYGDILLNIIVSALLSKLT